MIRPVIVTVAVAIGVTAVVAQSDPIAERRAIMKANGGAARTASQMLKGDVPFDLAKAQEIFAGFQTAAAKMPALYPDNSKTGGETTANEKVWTNSAAFKAAFDKFAAELQGCCGQHQGSQFVQGGVRPGGAELPVLPHHVPQADVGRSGTIRFHRNGSRSMILDWRMIPSETARVVRDHAALAPGFKTLHDGRANLGSPFSIPGDFSP